MSHILLIGVGPLPFYRTEHLYGFGIRTWQFAKPILAAGHKVTLVTCEFGSTREHSVRINYQTSPEIYGDIRHISLPQPLPKNINILLTRIEDIIESKKPDAIVSAGSTISSNLAASLSTNLPIWLDMFGDLFAEVQAKSAFRDNQDEIEFFHRTLSKVLLRGDRFSVVSEIQRGTAIGQLGLLGRLNRHTLGEELVYTVPCALDGAVSPVKRTPILRGKIVQESDFLILCSGGFNTWADVPTLFESIESAMDHNNKIHCIVTGGAITGHHEEGYNRFRSLISKSPYESRFHLMGWLPNEDVAQVTMECDLGINIDLPIYEALLGSRNRMLFWMQCGLPILTTVTTEISKILSETNLAYSVPTKNPKLTASKILEASQSKATRLKMATKAKRFAYDYFSFEETVKPLMQWVKKPERAKDNIEREIRKGVPFNPVDTMWYSWAFPENGRSSSLPTPPKTVIRTRPQGKSWWQRLWGS